jgi:hypothetical protein
VKKAQIKVELLPKYTAWADGVLAAGGAQQDDVLMFRDALAYRCR